MVHWKTVPPPPVAQGCCSAASERLLNAFAFLCVRCFSQCCFFGGGAGGKGGCSAHLPVMQPRVVLVEGHDLGVVLLALQRRLMTVQPALPSQAGQPPCAAALPCALSCRTLLPAAVGRGWLCRVEPAQVSSVARGALLLLQCLHLLLGHVVWPCGGCALLLGWKLPASTPCWAVAACDLGKHVGSAVCSALPIFSSALLTTPFLGPCSGQLPLCATTETPGTAPGPADLTPRLCPVGSG